MVDAKAQWDPQSDALSHILRRSWSPFRTAIPALLPSLLSGLLAAQTPDTPTGTPPPPAGQDPQKPAVQAPAGNAAPGQGPGTQGQGNPNIKQDPLDPNRLTFAFNETNGMELPEFIKWTERLTGKRFVFNEGELTQGAGANNRVNFVGTMSLRKERLKDDLFAFFQTMLYIKNFALVPRGEGDLELLEIVSMSGPRGREIANGATYVNPEDIQKFASQTGVQILTTLPLKYINATIATNALRPFFAAAGAQGTGGALVLGNVGNNTAMLLQGYGPQVFAAVNLLKLVDVPVEGPNLQIKVHRLEHAAAEDIEPVLNDILNDRNRTRTQAAQQPGAQGVSGGDIPGGVSTPLKITVHQGTKALILSGTADQIRDALELIVKLDVPPEPIDGQANVIRLKNVLANDLRTTLQQFVQQDSQAEQQAAAGGTPGGGAPTRRPRATVIQAHIESNSLLVSASQTKFRQIQDLIDNLDRRQPQVMIEAALVELTTDDLNRLGVELGLLNTSSSPNYTRGFGFTNFGQSTFQDTNGDGLPDTRLPDFTNPLQGLTGGIIHGTDFGMPLLINAIASDNRANILSLPSVLVNNNEPATVKTKESRPTTSAVQGTATTQTSNGQPRDAGITLEISPTISPNNYLRLNINLDISRFVGSFDPNSPTGGGVILSRTVKTQVTMPSGDTMVLGGVIEDQESKNVTGVPFLKDIPLLGFLFSKHEVTNSKTNLYFFVTPTILDEDDFNDLWQVSLQRKMEAQTYIGDRRLEIVDRKWTGPQKPSEIKMLEEKGSNVDHLDAQGSFEMPFYQQSPRDRRSAGAPSGPDRPSGEKKD